MLGCPTCVCVYDDAGRLTATQLHSHESCVPALPHHTATHPITDTSPLQVQQANSGLSDDHKNKILDTVIALNIFLDVPKPFTWIVHVSPLVTCRLVGWVVGLVALVQGVPCWVAVLACSA